MFTYYFTVLPRHKFQGPCITALVASLLGVELKLMDNYSILTGSIMEVILKYSERCKPLPPGKGVGEGR
jgi:hypothetical protein